MTTWLTHPCIGIALILTTAGAALAGSAPPQEPTAAWDELTQGPLPRWREGGTPPEDANQPLHPRAVSLVAPDTPPTSGLVASPPEYAPADGVLFRYSTGSWPSVVVDCVAALTGDPQHDEIAYVVVSSSSQQAAAANSFAAAGADLGKVVFAIEPTNSIWLRDYGPHFVWQSGARAIADSHYYPSRPLDNFVPTLLADDLFVAPPYPMGLYYSGGNFQPGPGRSGFVSSLIQQDNPEMSLQQIAELYRAYQGIDTLHVFPRLPGSVDGTGHIDMWMYLVDEDSVIISKFLPGSNPTAITITENAVPYMQGLGFEVLRVPAWNVGYTHYTYTNAFRVNDRIFVPIYSLGKASYKLRDRDAIRAWRAAAGPGVEIVPIDCYSIIPAAGAIHCIVMQVPRYTQSAPSAHVVSPDGGELLVPGSVHDLRWTATDDNDISDVHLSYSIDGGQTFPFLIKSRVPDLGHFAWTVPPTPSAETVLRVSASDASGNWVRAVSESELEIRKARQHVYDFKTGAGVDKWAWGYQTSTWNELEGVRHPAALQLEIEQISAGAYAKIAASDATGGDTDPNRYRSPVSSGGRESTHVFELAIDEDPACILDIGLVWEGYGDQCLQMEMYVWDDVAGNWADAAGAFGLNAYLANFAGNRDEPLEAHLRSDFQRYVDAAGRLTVLLYAERSSQESFHDYFAVTVTSRYCP